MKIKLKDLDRAKDISFSGQEPWLEGIKKSFSNRIVNPLEGSFHIERKSPSQILVTGQMTGKVEMPCALCGDLVPCEINENFTAEYVDEVASSENWEDPEFIKTLNSSEQETYPIEKDEIDLELSLNDAVQLSLPDRVVKTDADKKCLTCGDDTRLISQNFVTPLEKLSPFARLKDFKTKS